MLGWQFPKSHVLSATLFRQLKHSLYILPAIDIGIYLNIFQKLHIQERHVTVQHTQPYYMELHSI